MSLKGMARHFVLACQIMATAIDTVPKARQMSLKEHFMNSSENRPENVNDASARTASLVSRNLLIAL
ncbi:MAG: hypothetical protein IJ242_03175, partial [Clostridia bacterium]|nr:hypothetical protein [Clostridia bacterium]